MALIVSETSGGADVGTTKIDFGNIPVGADVTKDLYISHNYNNKITDVTLFFGQLSGTYDGDFDATTDWNELLSWGDNAVTDGAFLSQDSGSSFAQLKTGSLDAQANGVTVATSSGVSVAGEIATGEESHQQVKIHVPAGEDTGGVREFDFKVYYLYTS